MGPSRSSSLRIGDDSSTVAGFGRVRDAPIRSAAAEPQNAPGAPPLPLDKDKGKINLIKYPGGVRLPPICRSACYECGT